MADYTEIDIDLIAEMGMSAFNDHLLPLSKLALDAGPGPETLYDTIRIPIASSSTAGQYNASTKNYYTGGGSIDSRLITLNRRALDGFDLEDIQAHRTHPDSWRRIIEQKAQAVAKEVITDIMSVVTNSNFGAAVADVTPANFDKAEVRALKKSLDAAGAPHEGRFLILNLDFYEALLADVSDASAYGAPDPVQDGKFIKLYGFDVIGLDIIPGNSEALAGFAGVREGILVAMRSNRPPENLISLPQSFVFREATHEETGITLGTRVVRDESTGKTIVNFEVVYGYAKGLDNGIKRVTDATT